jgi:hypothetical protein
MRKAQAAYVLALAGGMASATAGAQQEQPPQQQPAGKYKAQALILHRDQLGSAMLGDLGRNRMRSGDCAGALEAFDAALHTSTEPALHRDRGSCHERLGHPYPAIDDYRAYLTVAPDAPDAEGIRERLVKLEQDTFGYSSASTDAPGEVDGSTSASVPVGAGAATASASTTSHGATGASRDNLEYVERDDDLLRMPLRGGKGWSISPFFSAHKWTSSAAQPGSGSSFGDAGTWAECVGLEFRYSFGPTTALLLEAGYEHFNSTAVDLAVISGLTSQVGIEWRFPLDVEYRNQLLLAPGIGFEHLVVQPSNAQFSAVSVGAFVPRVRFGWRHLLASSAGFELSVDGGAGNFFLYAKFPYDSNNPATALLALNAALVWGL